MSLQVIRLMGSLARPSVVGDVQDESGWYVVAILVEKRQPWKGIERGLLGPQGGCETATGWLYHLTIHRPFCDW